MEVFNSHHRQGYNQPVNTQEMGLFRAVPICRSSGQSDTESKSEENRREERKREERKEGEKEEEEGEGIIQTHSNLSIRPNLSLIKAQPVNLECRALIWQGLKHGQMSELRLGLQFNKSLPTASEANGTNLVEIAVTEV